MGTGGRQEQRGEADGLLKVQDNRDLRVFFKTGASLDDFLTRRTRKDVNKGHATGTRRLHREDASGWNN